MTKPLAQTLEDLKNVSADFNTVVENLFEFRFEDYNQVFKINELDVPAKTYKRFPVFNNENAVAILMLWGAENKTAIHDHKNYEGKIKVLKGELTEVYYKETKDFIVWQPIATREGLETPAVKACDAVVCADPKKAVSVGKDTIHIV